MQPTAPDRLPSAADERFDAPVLESDGAAAGSRSPSPAPTDAEARPAPAAVAATSTRTKEPCPENDRPPHLTLSARRTRRSQDAEPRNPSYRHLQAPPDGSGFISPHNDDPTAQGDDPISS